MAATEIGQRADQTTCSDSRRRWHQVSFIDAHQHQSSSNYSASPLISIFSHLIRSFSRPQEIHFIYGTKAESELDPQRILFLTRLMDLVSAVADSNVTLNLFLTGSGDTGRIEHGRLPNRTFARRILHSDLSEAIDGYKADDSGREHTVCYVCGPQRMTDDFVEYISMQNGMSEDRVLCEKWW